MSALHDELRGFFKFGSGTVIEEREIDGVGVPVYWNEFWTSRQRAGHSLHEVSYRACFKPQLPGFFIGRLCRPGDTVYDPFMGRGTTLIEAQLHGCRAIGNDASPLSSVLAAPRLAPPAIDEVAARLHDVALRRTGCIDPDLLVFFAPETLDELHGWRDYFRCRRESGGFDRVDAWLQMVAANRLTGHSKGFFSVHTLPPNQAVSVAAQRRINAKRNQSPDYRDTRALILRKTQRLLRDPLPPGYRREDWRVLAGPADHTPDIPANSVRLVVTSPPFLNTVDYVGDNWLRNWFCGIEVTPEAIWQIRSVEAWSRRMTGVFRELGRVLAPGGLVAFEVGEVRKGSLPLENEVVRAAMRGGLEAECILINTQNFTKTANCWGVSNNSKGTNSNRIVLLKARA